MRYFLHLAYQGTAYRGWQRQPNATSVQATIEAVCGEVWKREVSVLGCGRTDAGVHASQYFAYVDLEEELGDNALFILNRRLPADISIFGIFPVDPRAHPRYDATSRTYDYFLHTRKEAALAELSSWYDLELPEMDGMLRVLDQLPGKHDFRAYCKVPDRHNTTICDLTEAQCWTSVDGQYLRFRFTANRFVRGMIRLLVGNLLAVATGRDDEALFLERLRTGEAPPFFRPAHPQGLYLSGVKYPYLDVPNESGLFHRLIALTE